MNKRNQILAGLLILQVLIAAVVLWPRGTRAAAAALFPGVTSADIATLTLSDAEGSTLELAQRSGAWVLPQNGDFPARAEQVTSVIAKILALKTDRLIAENSSSHKRLQVAADDFVRKVDFLTTSGARHIFYLGSSPSARAAHFRVEGDDKVYLASDLTSYDLSPSPTSFIEAAYAPLTSTEVVAMTVRNSSGELRFRKDAAGAWTLAGLAPGQPLDANQVSLLITRVAGLSMTRPLGAAPDPAYGLDNPAAVVTLDLKPASGEARTVELKIGAHDAAESVYTVKSSESPYYVQVSDFAVEDFVTKAAADYVAQPTPPPAPTLGPAAN